jgi:hypothetical protein
LNEPDDGLKGLCRIREIAELLAQKTTDGRDVPTYVAQLSRLVVERGYPRTSGIWLNYRQAEGTELENHIYAAALATQTMSVVERWLSSGKVLEIDTPFFGHTQQLIADFGTPDLLAAVMIHDLKDMFNTIRLSILPAVARAGRVDSVRFVLGFERNGWSWEFFRQRRPSYRRQNEFILAELHTPNKEVFEVLMRERRLRCINRQFGEKEYTHFLRHCAVNGWTEMVACYLELGALVDDLEWPSVCCTERERPLLDACSNGHADIVKLLLNHGASTSAPALEYAAGKGHLRIVQMLLASGAEHGDALPQAAAKGYGDGRGVAQPRCGGSR